MASIGDLFFLFRGDDGQLQVDAGKAGDRAGQTLGQRLSAGAKAGLVGLGVAGGALFGIAAKGGAELTEAVAKYRAETGATAAEAEAAQASIGKLYKNNVAGFETLGAVLASVKTNLGLTGAAGEKAAQRILDFAKVTGQDAVVATGQLDDIMDSLNLSYEQGSGVLDQLVVSQQKFGGSVEGNAAALAALAPALNAANLSVDDGIGLLNLFAASGIDAADAPAALTKALTKVESPAQLQQLIDDINATTDPFERAAKASDLFGAKAGAKLANALDGVDFTTFVIGATEAGGAIDAASRVIDESPLNRLKLALKEVAGPLADVGTKFGPLVLGFTQLGGGTLIASAAAGIGGLAGKALPMLTTGLAGLLPALGGTLAAIGSGIGSLIAAAIPIGMALLPVILIAALVAAVVFLVNNPEIVGTIVEVVGGILTAFGDALGALVGIVGQVVGAAVGAFGAIVGGIADAIGQIVGAILSIPGKAAKAWLDLGVGVTEFIGKALGQFLDLHGKVVGFILSIPAKVAAWVGAILGQVTTLASTFLATIGSLVGSIVTFFLSIPGQVAGIGAEIVKGIIRGMASLPGQLLDTVANAFRSLRIDIGPFHISSSGVRIDLPRLDLPSFAVGIRDVPADMLAVLHRGEMVIPAAEAAAVRGGGALGASAQPAGAPSPSSSFSMGDVVIQAQSFAGSEAEARTFARSMFDMIEDEARRRGLRPAGAR